MNAPSPFRVLFLLERPEGWVNVHGLWRAMHDDPRFEAEVWIVPPAGLHADEVARQASRSLAMCRERGVAGVPWPGGDAVARGRFDVAVFHLPYDRHRPVELYFDHVARHVRFTVYVPYGLVTGDGEKNRRLQYALPPQRRASLVVARSHAEKRAYARFCPGGDGHVEVLGLPRLDELVDLEAFAVDPTLREKIDSRPAVLWNSHYTFLPRFAASENYSTFDRVAGPLLAFAAAHPEVALVWRPHPHLFGELVGAGILTGDQLASFKQEVDDLGVILDERPDHRHAFAASTALLTDAGSFLFEYLATGNPVLYLRNPDGEPLNEEAASLVRHYDVAESGEEAVAFVQRLLHHGDPRREERLAARDVYLPLFDGHASERVAARIAEMCGAPVRGRSRAAIDLQRFPLVDRLVEALAAIRRQKEGRSRTARTLARSHGAIKEWAMSRISERPALLRTLGGALERLGRRKASGG